MKFADFVCQDAIRSQLAAEDKEAVIRELVGALVAAGEDYERLSLPLRMVVKAVAKEEEGDHRDWDEIRRWATGLRSSLLSR